MKKRNKILLSVVGIIIAVIGIAYMNMGNIMIALLGEQKAKFEIIDDKAIMIGVINKDTPDEVTKLIKEHSEVKTIVMKDVAGSVDDEANLEACRIVRANNLNTHVPKDGVIASGGTDFFCSGVKRTIEQGAKIGVHSWSDGKVKDASTLPKDYEGHEMYLKYYREMDIPEDFYWFTIKVADIENIHNMTAEELQKYELVTE